jgi:hypothetical protein
MKLSSRIEITLKITAPRKDILYHHDQGHNKHTIIIV